METNVNYTIVGAFVVVLLTMIVLGVLWLCSGLSTHHNYEIYEVFMKESVSGLTVDSPVEYNGVQVGNVMQIKLNDKNPHLVELLLKITEGTPITVGTRAKLVVRAITGIARISLEDTGEDMTPLVTTVGQPYPVINTTPSFLLQLDTAISELTKNFRQMSITMQELLNQQNLRAIKQILASTQNTMHMLQAETLPETNQTLARFNDLALNLTALSVEIRRNPSILIRGKEQPALGPGEK